MDYQCKFGSGRRFGPQCTRRSVWVSTFQGKPCHAIDGTSALSWCHEHKHESFTEGHGYQFLPDQLPAKALSVRQPWAWLIVNGHKPFENRDWSRLNPGRAFRGPVLIHAGSTMTKREYTECAEICAMYDIERAAMEQLERGGIVGMTEIVEWCEQAPELPFAFRSGFRLTNSQTLPFIPCKGMLGFFKPGLTLGDLQP